MAKGDQTDFLARLRAVLPTGWFPDQSPVLDAVLTGIAYSLSWVYSLIQYARLQTRLLTATDVFLDILAYDFLGTRLSRFSGETDSHFRARIKHEILRSKGTRAALIQALQELTGYAPIVFEPSNSTDIGGGYNGPTMGYGASGYYGSLELPYQAFVTAFRPPASINVGPNAISDADIYAAAAAVIPAATVAWVQILDADESAVPVLGQTFILGVSKLS